MTFTATFDYDEYVRGFRAACAQHGIDPAVGATAYQVVHVVAERRRAAWQRDRWWQQHDLWLDCPPYRSDTEQAAIWGVFVQAYAIMAQVIARAVRLWRARASLRELHQVQHRRTS